MQLILASASPRRQELLKLFGIPFAVKIADIDETMDENGDPRQEVAAVSRRKAEAICAAPDDVIIAADTVVVCNGRILGKPVSEEHAFQMLCALAGRTHQVMTGVTVRKAAQYLTHTEIAQVRFGPMTKEDILAYIATGDPMDKAGAYGIQGGAALYIEGIEGDYYNVMGLPVCALRRMLLDLAPELFHKETV